MSSAVDWISYASEYLTPPLFINLPPVAQSGGKTNGLCNGGMWFV